MRKRYRILVFAALVAALAVPVGYAVSLESAPFTTTRGQERALGPVQASAAFAPVVRRSTERSPAPSDHTVPDAAKLLGVGTILFGLAAVLRRAT